MGKAVSLIEKEFVSLRYPVTWTRCRTWPENGYYCFLDRILGCYLVSLTLVF